MSKSFPVVIVIVTAVFARATPAAAQTNPEASPQRATESVPVCVPTKSTPPETVAAPSTVTFYNPTMASTPAVTFYNPTAFPPPPLTFYTPLGRIDPPIRVQRPLPSPPGQTMPSLSVPALPPPPSMLATQTIPAPGPCPPGMQIERPVR